MSASVVRKLLWGLTRRNRRALLPWIWVVPMIVRLLATEGANVTWFMAASMGLTFFIGLTSDSVFCREYRVLPVTDRDLWAVKWLNATVVAPLYLLLLKGVGLAVTAASGKSFMGLETLLLSTLYDSVYAGAVVALPLLLPRAIRPLANRVDRLSLPVGSPQRRVVGMITVTSVVLLIPLFYLLGVGGPLLFASALPTQLADFSTASTLSLVAGLAMSAAALLWTPPRGGAQPVQRAVTSAPATTAQPRLGDGLTGVHSVMWSHIKSVFLVTGVALAAVVAVAPFLDNSREPANARVLAGVFLALTFMFINMSGVWTPWVRQLKVLPVSAGQVNALFVLTPIVTWTEVCLMMVLIHTALGLPINEELGPASVLAYAGMCALTHAASLSFAGSQAGQAAVTVICMALAAVAGMTVIETPDRSTRALLLLLTAVTGLAVAAMVNHRTLTQSTSSARANRWPRTPLRP